MKLTLDLSALAPSTQDKIVNTLKEMMLKEAREIQEDLTYYTPDDRKDSAYKEMVNLANGAIDVHKQISNQVKEQQS